MYLHAFSTRITEHFTHNFVLLKLVCFEITALYHANDQLLPYPTHRSGRPMAKQFLANTNLHIQQNPIQLYVPFDL